MDQEQVITTLEGMTVLELNALVKQLEERWGVSAAAPMAVGVAAGATSGAATAAPERSRPSSTSCSPRSARTRFRLSRRCGS